MIGQRFPAADEPVRCITAIITPPGFGCKGLFSRVFRLPPPTTCATVPGTRPRVGDVSQERCHATGSPSSLCSLAAARGDCARAGKCPRSHPKHRGPPHRRGRRSRHGKNCPYPLALSTRTGLRPRFPIPPCLAPRRPHHRRQDAALPGSRNTATSRRRSSSAKSLVAGGL
jgi:hypothetical protein